MSETNQLETFDNKVGIWTCKGGKTTFIPSLESKKPEEQFIFGKINSVADTSSSINLPDIKQLIDESIKNYFIKQEQYLEQPRKELYDLTLKLNTLGYTNVFDKVSYYLQIHGNNLKSIQNLKKEMTETIKDKENMTQEYKHLLYELKSKYNIDYTDNPLKNITKDFYYEKNAVQILKQKLEENKKTYTYTPFFCQ